MLIVYIIYKLPVVKFQDSQSYMQISDFAGGQHPKPPMLLKGQLSFFLDGHGHLINSMLGFLLAQSHCFF